MTLLVKHRFTSPKADGADATLIRPSNWNDTHEFTMATGRMLGRLTAGDGVVEELTPEQARSNMALGTAAVQADTRYNHRANNLSDVADAAAARANLAAVWTSTTITAGTGLTGGGDLSANRSLALTGQALALHNLAVNGIITRTGAGTVTGRTITAGSGISVSNGDGVSGNPTISIVLAAGSGLTYAANAMSINYAAAATWSGSHTFQSGVTIRNASPTLILRDTDHRSAQIHTNSDLFYVLRGGVDDAGFDAGPNGRHPLTLSLSSGDLTISGNVTAYSDERLKTDWAEIRPEFIDHLADVRVGTFTRLDDETRQIGVSAQSLQVVAPEAVHADEDGLLAVAYGNAALAAAVMLAREVRELRRRIEELEAR